MVTCMDININSPAYYSSIYGVNDAVYNLCKDIRLFVKDKSYSDKVNIIGICPIVAPESEINKWKEEVKYDFKYSMVTIWKRIDYNSFVSSGDQGKCKLMLNCILESIKHVSRKSKLDFNRFENDIIIFLSTHSKYCSEWFTCY